MKVEFTNFEQMEMQYVDFLDIIINSIKCITIFILRLCLNSSVHNKHKYMIMFYFTIRTHICVYLFTLYLNCSTAEYLVLKYLDFVLLLPYLF